MREAFLGLLLLALAPSVFADATATFTVIGSGGANAVSADTYGGSHR
jgi:hypothetical protein